MPYASKHVLNLGSSLGNAVIAPLLAGAQRLVFLGLALDAFFETQGLEHGQALGTWVCLVCVDFFARVVDIEHFFKVVSIVLVYNDASRQRASAADKRRPIHEKIGYDGQCSSFRWHNICFATCNTLFIHIMQTLSIQHGTLVTMDQYRRVLGDSWVHVQDGRIVALGVHAESVPPPADRVIDARGKVVLPGFINAHTHVNQILLRGGPSHGRQLYDWLFNVLYPGQKAMRPEDVAVAVRLYCAEAVRSGITTINDNADSAIYPGNIEAAMAVYGEVGVRVVYARMFFDRMDGRIQGYVDALKARSPQVELCSIMEETAVAKDRITALSDQYHGTAGGRISVWPAPAITPAVTVEGMRWAQAFARDRAVMWTLHMAESDHDERLHWMSPAEYMECYGLLDERLQVAHCVYFDRKDVRLLHRHNVKVASQVVSNAYLGSGVAPVPEMVERGMAVGIGTDDGNCNDSVNMIGDMKFMAHIHRAVHRDADVLTPEKILEMATIDGARSLGMDHEIGSIETGKRADLILLDLRHPQTTPHHHLAATIVFQAYGNEVDTVLIDGNVVMENRRLSFLPPERELAFLEEAQSRATAILQRANMVANPAWRSL